MYLSVSFEDDIQDEKLGFINPNSFNPLSLEMKPLEVVEVGMVDA